MLATGSDDFADILLPLLTDKDRQVRISAYEAGDAFYLTSLGADWRRIVESWDEDAFSAPSSLNPPRSGCLPLLYLALVFSDLSGVNLLIDVDRPPGQQFRARSVITLSPSSFIWCFLRVPGRLSSQSRVSMPRAHFTKLLN
jgi:hypothetical protein